MYTDIKKYSNISQDTLTMAFRKMATAVAMSTCYDRYFQKVSKYVHATSRGHEAIQIALGIQLEPDDFVSPYYRDDALLLSIGMTPYQLMLQLMAKKDDPFSGGRTYYSHPSLNEPDKPKIIHQSSATGMQAIPATGIGLGIRYRERQNLKNWPTNKKPISVCSIGDASMTEGEVAEALQAAVLYKLPILFVVQDNGWDISAKAEEIRAMNAFEYAKGFPGMTTISIDGSDFEECYLTVKRAINHLRNRKGPYLIHASVPLLNHHTSGVRMEWYRDDLEMHRLDDPFPKLRGLLEEEGIDWKSIESKAMTNVEDAYLRASRSPEPDPESIYNHIFAPSSISEEKGIRTPPGGEKTVMVDAALRAVQNLLKDYPETVLYGQDVGARLGGVFREAATLGKQFGEDRVFNTAIQEAFIVGSTVGMSAVGLKPIVEVQFADYIWPGLNQLFTEVSRSNYLSNGKWPVSMVLRVPTGAYGAGGPFHSSSVESILTNIKGIKIVYPSNGADLYGLMNAAYHDPNPVIILEHKGLYWSKVPGTQRAKCPLPSSDYIWPIGKGRMQLEATSENEKCLVVTYGMGVHWAMEAASEFDGKVGVLDLVSLSPLDLELIFDKVKGYHRVVLVTEEREKSGFIQSLAGMIQEKCFKWLDAPILTIGSAEVPAIPLNSILEKAVLPNKDKVSKKIKESINF